MVPSRGADIIPTAAGVGVAGGRIGWEAFFLLGVAGPASLPLVRVSADSCATLFLFLLVLATFGGVGLFVRSSLAMDEAALNRVDLLEDIAWRGGPRGFAANRTSVDLKMEGR